MNLFRKIPFTKYFTPRKFTNFLIIYSEMYLLKKLKLKGKPYRMIIDTNNTCNLKCPLCPTGKGDKRRKRGYMKFDQFKKIIDESYKYLYSIDLYNWGEPFLHPDIFKMIRYAKNKNIKINLSSNLNHFNEEMAKELVQSKLDNLTVSLDGIDQKTYEKYRVGGKFNKVIESIKQIQKEKKIQKTKYPKVTWQMLVMKQNEEHLPKSKELAKELGINLEIKKVRPEMGVEILNNDENIFNNSQDWIPENEELSIYDSKTKKRKKISKICKFLWTCPTINWNGSVSPCCSIYPECFDFGNIFEEGSFRKIWNNKKYQSARMIVGKGKRSEKVATICTRCYHKGLL